MFPPRGCYVRSVTCRESDNIQLVLFGPWVDDFRQSFEDIDEVRKAGGFLLPYIWVAERE